MDNKEASGSPLSGSSSRWRSAAIIILLVIIASLAIAEWRGWPFLANPLQRILSSKLDRRILISAATPDGPRFRVHFLGGIRLYAGQVEIASPAWSQTPHLLLAKNLTLQLGYADLWHAYKGQLLKIQNLQAENLDGQFERLADGRATWQLGPQPAAGTNQPLPFFDHLQITNGTVLYRDAPFRINTKANFSLINGTSAPSAEPLHQSNNQAANQSGSQSNRLKVNATGHYRNLPLNINLTSSGILPWTVNETPAKTPVARAEKIPQIPVQLTLDATVGNANLIFNGNATDIMHLGGFDGNFSLKGPSLAAVGQPAGVTLPTTPPFRTHGIISKRDTAWHVVIDDATVGASRLKGEFTYETSRSVPLLSGKLSGPRLLLIDLGPVVGTTPATPEFSAAPVTVRPKDKVLPSRPFDLASLRIMDADVVINIDSVDLNTTLLEPLRPLKTHLRLNGGVLTLSDLQTHFGQGKLMGRLGLDGRGSKALWNANLRWQGVKLERWIHQTRSNGAPPYVTGRLDGRTILKGKGRSTAEILGSLKGHVRTELRSGTISHLIVELAGLDVAESLGVFLKGDDALPVQCAVADLSANKGLFRPRLLVVDTSDSAVWVDGSVSLAKEALDLRAVVTPKDFSPLTLRTPLQVRGTFAHPHVSVQNQPLGRKLASSLLLSLLNPIAAIIPLVDKGDAEAAKRQAAGCETLMAQSKVKFPPDTATQ